MSVPTAADARKDATPIAVAMGFFFVLTACYIVRPVRDHLGGAAGSSPLP